ncbi:MAG: hypothetical protein ACI30S_06050 [Muribaculaceae bacterium]
MKINWLKRTLKAPDRFRTSKGFGVHSPFAYAFITRVLRESLPYYAYSDQKCRYSDLKNNSLNRPFLNLKRIRLLFRTVNYFTPSSALQIGSDCGLVTSALLDVKSDMIISRFACDDDFSAPGVSVCNCIDDAKNADLVIVVTAESFHLQIFEFLKNTILEEKPLIFPCIDQNSDIADIWVRLNDFADSIGYGMTFTNYRFGVLVPQKQLPRQLFTVWL